MSDGLRALVVDDEVPARDELAWLLRRDERIGTVHVSASATDALLVLRRHDVDVVLLDVSMPGLDGLELASVLRRFQRPPAIVFVTAHEQHALEAFDLQAVDYVLKPVREERLAEAVRRAASAAGGSVSGSAERAPAAGGTGPTGAAAAGPPTDVEVPVERGGVMRFVPRSRISHVEAQGDYARLHAGTDSYLVRIPLAQLAEEWAEAGFVRIHRSSLVSLAHVEEVRTDAGRCTVRVRAPQGGTPVDLAVSRRHARELRDLLLRVRT
ncbi:response regulator transcription factor [Nocardioides sp. TRM66260-LWL]|uniref:LytR/AlgR family response regulator transcription factor n=1 Tax=Nocardioides sp. TRM66260-LWL TaxID=2874478 RepID=UPI001CC3EF32|nr:response regulator transcription factor [Nocardioides sp. TRM66260-LWL]MBZ5736341.1 response regulator transcription factor [Nocardioides sp. TRM66260-LWL]